MVIKYYVVKIICGFKIDKS